MSTYDHPRWQDSIDPHLPQETQSTEPEDILCGSSINYYQLPAGVPWRGVLGFGVFPGKWKGSENVLKLKDK